MNETTGGQERSDLGNVSGGQERSDLGNAPGAHERSDLGNVSARDQYGWVGVERADGGAGEVWAALFAKGAVGGARNSAGETLSLPPSSFSTLVSIGKPWQSQPGTYGA